MDMFLKYAGLVYAIATAAHIVFAAAATAFPNHTSLATLADLTGRLGVTLKKFGG